MLDKERFKDFIKENNIIIPPPINMQNTMLKPNDVNENKNQEELRIQELSPKKEKNCIHHHRKLALYCESCEEVICEQCSVLGPHNNQLHRINLIPEAYKSRLVNLYQLIEASLLPKRDQLIAQIHRIDYRTDEIRGVKTIIDRDIRTEYAQILERLRASEGSKLAILQHDIAQLQNEIDKINDIVQSVQELTGKETEPIDFLNKYQHLTDVIEFTLAMTFKTNIDVVVDDLPKELLEKRDKIEKMTGVQQVLSLKDQVILAFIKKHQEAQKVLTGKIKDGAKIEIDEWTKLTDKFSTELKKYHKICYYCACSLDNMSINTVCNSNNRTQIPIGFGFTTSTPERLWHATRRHYFGFPKPELVKAGHIIGSPIAEATESVFHKQHHMFLEVLLAKVKKYCHEKSIQVDKIFKDHDKEKKGFVSHIAFTFLLGEHCQVDQSAIASLKTILDPLNSNKIPYEELLKMLKDPKYLIEFQKKK